MATETERFDRNADLTSAITIRAESGVVFVCVNFKHGLNLTPQEARCVAAKLRKQASRAELKRLLERA